MTQFSPRFLYGGLIVAVLWIGTLGFVGASRIEPMNPDEAMYLRQARFISRVIRLGVGSSVPVLQEDRDGIWRYVRKDDWYSKPCWAHSALYATPAVLGCPLQQSAMIMNVLFGVAGVILVFLIGRRCGGLVPGAISALFLSVSFYWLLYVRSFMAEVDSATFVLLATWLLIAGTDANRGWWWRVALAGLASALAGLCHYRILYTSVLLAGFACFLYRGRRVRATGIFVAAGLVFVIILDLAMSAATSIMAKGLPFTGLIGAILERYLPGSSEPSHTAFQPANILAYVGYMLRYQGVVIVALAVVGVVRLVRDRSRQGAAVLAVIATTLFVLTCQKWIVARAGVLMVPYVCIAGGVGLGFIVQRAQRTTTAYVILLGAVLLALVQNVPSSAGLLRNEYGYGEVARFLQKEKAETVYADSEGLRIIELFAPGLKCRRLRDLAPPLPEGSYAVFDSMRFHAYPRQAHQIAKLESDTAAQSECVLRARNMTTTWSEFLRDGTQAHTRAAQTESILSVDEDTISSIRVYKHQVAE